MWGAEVRFTTPVRHAGVPSVDVTGAGKALLFGKVKRIHGQCPRKTLLILPGSNLATEGEAVMRS